MRTSATSPPLGRMLTACVRPLDVSDIAALKAVELIWPSSWFSAIRPVRFPDTFRETSLQYPLTDLPEASTWLLMSNLKLSLAHTIARLTAAPPLTSEYSRPAAHRLLMAVRPDDLTSAAPLTDEVPKWTGRGSRGILKRRG